MNQRNPKGELVIQTIAMPMNTNANGDIFGGWLLSQMDLGAGIVAKKFSKSRTVTITIESMTFKQPVWVGDIVSCYGQLLKVGKTSMRIHIEAWVTRQLSEKSEIVTEGEFVFVAIDKTGKPHTADPAKR